MFFCLKNIVLICLKLLLVILKYFSIIMNNLKNHYRKIAQTLFKNYFGCYPDKPGQAILTIKNIKINR